MEQLMEQLAQNKDQRIMTLSLFRQSIRDFEERFEGSELEYRIWEYIAIYTEGDFGFASWWLRKRAYWDRFLAEAERQAQAGRYSEDANLRALWSTLAMDVIDYLTYKKPLAEWAMDWAEWGA